MGDQHEHQGAPSQHVYENFSISGADVYYPLRNDNTAAKLYGVHKAEFSPLPEPTFSMALATLHSGFVDEDFLSYIHGVEVQEITTPLGNTCRVELDPKNTVGKRFELRLKFLSKDGQRNIRTGYLGLREAEWVNFRFSPPQYKYGLMCYYTFRVDMNRMFYDSVEGAVHS